MVEAKSSSSSSVICQTTGPKPLPKRFLHLVRSRASCFKWQYPLLSLRSCSSFLRLLSRLLVTSIRPFIFPSITCCRRQFLRKVWRIQLAFRFLISCRIFHRLCIPLLSLPKEVTVLFCSETDVLLSLQKPNTVDPFLVFSWQTVHSFINHSVRQSVCNFEVGHPRAFIKRLVRKV